MANTFIFDDEAQPDMGSPLLPEQGDDDDQTPEEGEGNNRIFIMLLIGIGGFALVAILCIIGYFALSRPGGLLARIDPTATSLAATQQALVSQQTQEALASPTRSSVATVTPTTTSVLFAPATDTPLPDTPTINPDMATIQVQQTQLAKVQAQNTATFAAKLTPGARTATPHIPNTGFADEVGLPGLVIVTIILLGIILLARRLRAAPVR